MNLRRLMLIVLSSLSYIDLFWADSSQTPALPEPTFREIPAVKSETSHALQVFNRRLDGLTDRQFHQLAAFQAASPPKAGLDEESADVPRQKPTIANTPFAITPPQTSQFPKPYGHYIGAIVWGTMPTCLHCREEWNDIRTRASKMGYTFGDTADKDFWQRTPTRQQLDLWGGEPVTEFVRDGEVIGIKYGYDAAVPKDFAAIIAMHPKQTQSYDGLAAVAEPNAAAPPRKPRQAPATEAIPQGTRSGPSTYSEEGPTQGTRSSQYSETMPSQATYGYSAPTSYGAPVTYGCGSPASYSAPMSYGSVYCPSMSQSYSAPMSYELSYCPPTSFSAPQSYSVPQSYGSNCGSSGRYQSNFSVPPCQGSCY